MAFLALSPGTSLPEGRGGLAPGDHHLVEADPGRGRDEEAWLLLGWWVAARLPAGLGTGGMCQASRVGGQEARALAEGTACSLQELQGGREGGNGGQEPFGGSLL